MGRERYVVSTIESTAWLVGSHADKAHTNAILERATEMLVRAWTCEYNVSKGEHCRIFAFWDAVAGSLNKSIVYSFQAAFGEIVNPPGDVGNVRLTFQSNKGARYIVIHIGLYDRLRREDYDMICEKAALNDPRKDLLEVELNKLLAQLRAPKEQKELIVGCMCQY
jgi:hypothetical protein